MAALAGFLLSITGSVAARVLTSLGIGIFSYAALTTFATNIIAAAQNAYGGASGDVLQILNLAGVGESFGIIAAGFTTRASLAAIKRMRPI